MKNLVSETVRNIIKEESWRGDINPRAIQGFQKYIATECLSEFEQVTDNNWRVFAKSGNAHQAEVLCEQIKIYAKAINQYGCYIYIPKDDDN